MKTIYGKCESSKQISLSKAAKILSKFVSVDNGASEAINAFLRRSSAAFNELNHLHKELKSSHSHKKKNHQREDTQELSNGHVKSDNVVVDDEEKSTRTAVKLREEQLNGSVNLSGSENRKKKNKNKKQEIDGDSRSEFGGREQNGILSDHTNSGMEDKKEKKKKNKHKNVESGEISKGQEQQQKETENGGLVGSQDTKMEQRKKRKFESVEDKSGDLTDKRIKRKH